MLLDAKVIDSGRVIRAARRWRDTTDSCCSVSTGTCCLKYVSAWRFRQIPARFATAETTRHYRADARWRLSGRQPDVDDGLTGSDRWRPVASREILAPVFSGSPRRAAGFGQQRTVTT